MPPASLPPEPGERPVDPSDDGASALEPQDQPGEPAAEAADEEPAEPAASEEPEPRGSPLAGWAYALIVAAIATAATYAAAQPARMGSRAMLGIVGASNAALALAAVVWLRRSGQLQQRLRPAAGDVTKGFGLALLLYGAAWVASHFGAAPGSVREGWLARIYLQLGDPYSTTRYLVGLSVLLLGALSEVAWRAGVMPALGSAHGTRGAWVLTAVLEALTWVPTVWLLRDPAAGLNPALVTGVLVAGLAFGAVATYSRRVVPVAIGHGLLGWALVEYRLWSF